MVWIQESIISPSVRTKEDSNIAVKTSPITKPHNTSIDTLTSNTNMELKKRSLPPMRLFIKTSENTTSHMDKSKREMLMPMSGILHLSVETMMMQHVPAMVSFGWVPPTDQIMEVSLIHSMQ